MKVAPLMEAAFGWGGRKIAPLMKAILRLVLFFLNVACAKFNSERLTLVN